MFFVRLCVFGCFDVGVGVCVCASACVDVPMLICVCALVFV